MSTRTNPIHEARRLGRWILHTLGQDLRIARINAGMTQKQVGRVVGRSASWICRIEAGKVPGVSLTELAVIAAAVGMKLWTDLYPAGRRPLGAVQLDMIHRFNRRIHDSFDRELEKPMPKEGDLRAADEFIRNHVFAAMVEAVSRFASVDAQIRSFKAKQRDLGADRLIVLVKASHVNRRMLREAWPMIEGELPIQTREALRALGSGNDPGGNCLILL